MAADLEDVSDAVITTLRHQLMRYEARENGGETRLDLSPLSARIISVGEMQKVARDFDPVDGALDVPSYEFRAHTDPGDIVFACDPYRGINWRLDPEHEMADKHPQHAQTVTKWDSPPEPLPHYARYCETHLWPDAVSHESLRRFGIDPEAVTAALRGFVVAVSEDPDYKPNSGRYLSGGATGPLYGYHLVGHLVDSWKTGHLRRDFGLNLALGDGLAVRMIDIPPVCAEDQEVIRLRQLAHPLIHNNKHLHRKTT